MQRVEKHIVLKTNQNYRQIDILSFACKNLYNKANYVVRQEFIGSSKLVEIGEAEHVEWVRYQDLDKLAKKENWTEYKDLPAQTAQQVLMLLEKNWKSFFASIKTFKTSGCLGKPKLPNYKHKSKGRFIVVFTGQQICLKNQFIHFPKKAELQPIKTKQTEIKQIRIIPQSTCYIVEVIYKKEVTKNENLNDNLYVGIDLGLNNLATIASNKIGLQPILVNGRPLKSMNQYFNKVKAEFQSFIGDLGISNRILNLLHKRNNKVQNYLHHTSRFIVDYCLENNIGNIVIGKNDGWKTKIDLGKKTNQNFVSVPFQTLIKQIKYKAEEVGITVKVSEESFTSKASFLDQDEIPIYKKDQQKFVFSGRRIKRGLYKSNSGRLISADLNGALNILRKVIPNAFADGIEGIGLYPIKINFNKDF
ncbi:MAG: transposase [archaeon]